MNYWLVKSEPFKYSWEKFEQEGQTFWDGVRNYQARNNLRAMQVGDLVFFYHSNEGMEIVGIAEVIKTAYQDPTTDDERWSVVDLKCKQKLKRPVRLTDIKNDEILKEMSLVKQSRLSVMPVTKEQFDRVLMLSES